MPNLSVERKREYQREYRQRYNHGIRELNKEARKRVGIPYVNKIVSIPEKKKRLLKLLRKGELTEKQASVMRRIKNIPDCKLTVDDRITICDVWREARDGNTGGD